LGEAHYLNGEEGKDDSMRREIGTRGRVEGLKLIPRLGKRHVTPEFGKDVADARREETRLEPG
jgi:hypothetical protein